MNEIQLVAYLDTQRWHLFYSSESSELIPIDSQDVFAEYLALSSRPPLLVEVLRSDEKKASSIVQPEISAELPESIPTLKSDTGDTKNDYGMTKKTEIMTNNFYDFDGSQAMAETERSEEESAPEEILLDRIDDHDHTEPVTDSGQTDVSGMCLRDLAIDELVTDHEHRKAAMASSDKNDQITSATPSLLDELVISDDEEQRMGLIDRDEMPSLQQLQRITGRDNKVIRIMNTVAPEWEELAMSMGLEAHVISTIKRDNLQDSKGATRQLFMTWLEGKAGSWEELVECLDDAGFSGIASDLRDIF